MAASIAGSRLFLIRGKRCLPLYSPVICEQFTYCKKVYYSRAIKEHSTNAKDHKITTESKVDQAAADFLEQSCVGVSGFVNYKRHPGVMRKHVTKLPIRLVKSVKILLERYPVEELTAKTQKLVRYLQQRQPPLTDNEINVKANDMEQRILEKDKRLLSALQGDEKDTAVKELEQKVLTRLRKVVYHWQPMQYDAFTSYIYMMGRVAPDYAVHSQCFTEVAKRDPEFKPTSVFYLGSRVGSGIWAADKQWKGIGEHYCVDSSGFMNTIARLLLQGGKEQNSIMSIKGVHFRQFAPSPKENIFSMVVCPYMLLEQASAKDRLKLVLDLWEMTDKYLVLIENGTTAGFNLIDEAKEFLLQVSGDNPNTKFEGHVFSPCPHDVQCPKKRDKQQPCLTECASSDVDFTAGKVTDRRSQVRYSFVILKKGPRESETAWPRVLQLNKARRHNHCHLCLPCGQLQHVVITKGKFEKHLYGCSKYVDQGDFLPLKLSKFVTDEDVDKDNTMSSAVKDCDDGHDDEVFRDDDPVISAEGDLTSHDHRDDGDDINKCNN